MNRREWERMYMNTPEPNRSNSTLRPLLENLLQTLYTNRQSGSTSMLLNLIHYDKNDFLYFHKSDIAARKSLAMYGIKPMSRNVRIFDLYSGRRMDGYRPMVLLFDNAFVMDLVERMLKELDTLDMPYNEKEPLDTMTIIELRMGIFPRYIKYLCTLIESNHSAEMGIRNSRVRNTYFHYESGMIERKLTFDEWLIKNNYRSLIFE